MTPLSDEDDQRDEDRNGNVRENCVDGRTRTIACVVEV